MGVNSFKTTSAESQICLFGPDAYYLGVLQMSSGIGLKIFITLASRLDASGRSRYPTHELSEELGKSIHYVRKGLTELMDKDLIKKQSRGTWELNPRTFRPAVISQIFAS